jgi:hypothetical protein
MFTRYIGQYDDSDNNESESDPETNEPVNHTENKPLETISDPYAIRPSETNKDGLIQPQGYENGVLPKFPAGMLIIGRTGSGKTEVMLNMLSNARLLKNYFDEVILWTGIKSDKTMISSLGLKEKNVRNDFTEDQVKAELNKQEKNVDKKGMHGSKKVLYIFDDFLNKAKFIRSPTLKKIVTANRHINLSYMCLSQYYRGVPPIVRQNVAYLIYFPASELENLKLADEMCPPNMSKRNFLKLIKHATDKKYSFLSINTRCEASKQLRKGFNEILQINS